MCLKIFLLVAICFCNGFIVDAQQIKSKPFEQSTSDSAAAATLAIRKQEMHKAYLTTKDTLKRFLQKALSDIFVNDYALHWKEAMLLHFSKDGKLLSVSTRVRPWGVESLWIPEERKRFTQSKEQIFSVFKNLRMDFMQSTFEFEIMLTAQDDKIWIDQIDLGNPFIIDY